MTWQTAEVSVYLSPSITVIPTLPLYEVQGIQLCYRSRRNVPGVRYQLEYLFGRPTLLDQSRHLHCKGAVRFNATKSPHCRSCYSSPHRYSNNYDRPGCRGARETPERTSSSWLSTGTGCPVSPFLLVLTSPRSLNIHSSSALLLALRESKS
jgi:hypothetical protein